MISTNDLTYHYHHGPAFVFPNMLCAAREQLLVLGQSGVGKSTLLHLMGGLMQPSAGSISIGGTDITKLSGRAMDSFRGNNIGIIFQQNHFVEALSVLDNLLLAQSLSGNVVDTMKCTNLLDRLNIGRKATKNTKALSQGERQRAAIARALVNNPSIILADEPTSALDDDNCSAVLDMLREQAANEGAALVIVTHDGRLKNRIDNHIHLGKEIQV